MIPFKLVGSLSVATLLALGCSGEPRAETRNDPPAFNLDATRPIIAQQNKQFTDAHVAGNVAAIDAMFTSDARSYPPGASSAVGLPAIHALTVEFLKIGVTEFREETTAFHGNTEYVFDEGTYVLTYGKGVTERGKYINVWKHVGENWRIEANIWNADAAVAASK